MKSYRLVGSVAVAACGLAFAGAIASARGPAAPQAPSTLDFTRDVQPIPSASGVRPPLPASCVRCHGAALAEGKLRLDTREGLLRGGASGPAVLPGNGAGSLLYRRVVLDDPAKRMPWLSEPLPPGQIATLRQWIDAGARWPEGIVLT